MGMEVKCHFLLAAALVWAAAEYGCSSGGAPAAAQPAIADFSAQPGSIVQGGTAVLTGTFTQGAGVVSPGGLACTSGTGLDVAPVVTTTYTLTVAGAPGTAPTTRTATVTVTPGPPGSLDLAFGTAGIATVQAGTDPDTSATFFGVALQPDGKIVAVGAIVGPTPATPTTLALLRFNPDGSLDPGFGAGGQADPPAAWACSSASALALQADGRIIVCGTGELPTAAEVLVLARYWP